MFQVTRIATSLTNTARKAVNNVGKGRIKLEQASDSFKKFHTENLKGGEYVKNIFKRGITWVKEFIKNYKEVATQLKETLKRQKEELGEKFTKATKKETVKAFFNSFKERLDGIKAEMAKLMEAGKEAVGKKVKKG